MTNKAPPVAQNELDWRDNFPLDFSNLETDIPDTSFDDMDYTENDILTDHSIEQVIEEVSEVQQHPLTNFELDRAAAASFAGQVAFCSKESGMLSSSLSFDLSQMGAVGYKNIVETGIVIYEDKALRFHATNSPFSDHIRTVEQLLAQKLNSSRYFMNSGAIRYVKSHVLHL
jgi:hypothetical protein